MLLKTRHLNPSSVTSPKKSLTSKKRPKNTPNLFSAMKKWRQKSENGNCANKPKRKLLNSEGPLDLTKRVKERPYKRSGKMSMSTRRTFLTKMVTMMCQILNSLSARAINNYWPSLVEERINQPRYQKEGVLQTWSCKNWQVEISKMEKNLIRRKLRLRKKRKLARQMDLKP